LTLFCLSSIAAFLGKPVLKKMGCGSGRDFFGGDCGTGGRSVAWESDTKP
jgi:hypothetical protein